LSAFDRFPGSYIPPQESIFHGTFQDYFQQHPRGFPSFQFFAIAWPRIKQENIVLNPLAKKKDYQPKKNNYHGVVISKFWADFLRPFIATHGYKAVYQAFAKDFLQLTGESYARWLEQFHLHFISETEVQPDARFWKDFLISDHGGTIAGLISYKYLMFEFVKIDTADIREDADIGFKPINPLEVYVNCTKAILEHVV
jgi:hypothetical protein